MPATFFILCHSDVVLFYIYISVPTHTMPSNALFVLYFAQLDDKISGRIFADNLNNPLSYIMRWDWNFSPQKSVVERPTQTWRANELPFSYPC